MALFSRKAPPPPPTVPDGTRIYAIGDVHGRLDLLTDLLARIQADDGARDPADTQVILLGDLIDRGPESAAVVRLVMQRADWATLHVLQGNHEAALLGAIGGDRKMLRVWLANGGVEAALSWGIDAAMLEATADEIVAALVDAIPLAERAWLSSRPRTLRRGDYLFVHAGIRPGIPFERQRDEDILWIREAFLSSERNHGAVVVHGHSISEAVEERANRIGIDTGAYATGRLTALALEGRDRWYLQTGETGSASPQIDSREAPARQ